MKDDIARPKVILDGKQAEQELENLTKKALKYRDAMLAAAAAGDSKTEKRMAAEFKSATQEIGNFKKEALSVEKVLKNINGASLNEIAAASRKATADLKKMQQTDPGYKQQQQDAALLKNKLAELGRQSGVNVSIWEKLKTTASGLLPAFGVAALSGAVVAAFTKIKDSTHATADAWEFAMGGMRTGLDHLFKILATGDWSNFTKRMADAVKAGYEYAKMLDLITDQTRALGVIESDARGEALRLEEALKNKQLSPTDRIKAGQDRIQLEKDLSAKRQQIANEAYTTELKEAERQTGLSKEQLQKVAGTISAERVLTEQEYSEKRARLAKLQDLDKENTGSYAISKLKDEINASQRLEADAYDEKVASYKKMRDANFQVTSGGDFGPGMSGGNIKQLPDTDEMKTILAQIKSTKSDVIDFSETMKKYDIMAEESQIKFTDSYKKRNEAINSAPENLKKVITRVNSLLAGEEDTGQKLEDKTAKAKKEEADKVLKDLEVGYKEQQLFLKDKYAGEETLQKEYHARMLANELAYLIAKQNLANDDLTYLDLQSQILDKQKEYTEALKETVPELLNAHDGTEKLNTRLLEESKLMNLVAAKQSEAAIATEEMKAKQESLANIYQTTIEGIATGVNDLASGTEDALKTMAKNLLIFALEQLKMQTELAVAGVTIQGLASLNPAMMLVAAAKIAAIEVVFAGIEGLVNKAFSPKKDKKSGYESGGWTQGEGLYMAGEKGKKEYITPNWMLQDPGTKQVVDLMEINRRSGTTRTINMRAIGNALINKDPVARAIKKQHDKSEMVAQITSEPELKRILSENTAVMKEILKWNPSISIETYERKKTDWHKTVNGGLK